MTSQRDPGVTLVDYADLAKTDGVGRDVLEARLRWAARELKILNDNLTATQARCTELLLELAEGKEALRLDTIARG